MKSLFNDETGRDGQRALSQLVDLVRDTFDGELGAREQAGLVRFEQAIARKTLRSNRNFAWSLGFAAAAAGAIALVVTTVGRDAGTLTFNVLNGTVSDAGYVRATGLGDTELRFSDGSNLALDPGTRTRVAEVDAHGGRVLIENGRARVKVTHRPRAKWTVDAGPYSVKVTGTEFDVRWSAEDELFDVRLLKGSIIVKGPLASAGLAMEAGQRLVANVKEGEIFLESTPTAGPAKVGASAGSGEAGPELGPPAPTLNHRSAGSHGARSRAVTLPGRGEPGWSQRIARGEFQAVLQDAEQKGIDATLRSASAADLAALADAARYVRRGELARRALLAERRRFPDSIHAREAAFFLGGLSEDETGTGSPRIALDWYERYLGESPRGPYAPQALGRQMVLVHKLRGAAAARSIAEEYLERFPDGPYAAPARKLLEAR